MRSESLNHLQTLDGSMQSIIIFVGSLAPPFWDMVTQFPGGQAILDGLVLVEPSSELIGSEAVEALVETVFYQTWCT